jgi:SAM-dependent methyltransferase
VNWRRLLSLARRRYRSDRDYRAFQDYQGALVVEHLLCQGVPLRGALVLDLGSGGGGYSSALAEAGARVVSTDIQQPGGSAKRFVLADALRPPFCGESYSLVFCASLIEHVADPLQLLLQARRVLVPDGLLYVSYPPFYSPLGGHQFKPFHLLGERWALRLSKHKASSWATACGDWGLYPLSIRAVRKLLSSAGLTIVDESTRYLPVNLARIPLLGEFLTWHVQWLLRK